MIIKDVDLNSDKWCDLVFEGKNQEYGAYYLRKTSSKRHLLALLVVIIPIFIVLFLLKFIHFNPVHFNPGFEVKAIELADLSGLEEKTNNPVQTEKKPPLEEIVKFTPPIIGDSIVVNDLEEELQKTTTDSVSVSDSIDIVSALKEELREEEAIRRRVHEQDTLLIDENNRDAEFPGGRIALIQYIYQHIQYSSAALKQRIQGRVVSSFIIHEDGSVSDITLIQGVYSFLDDEALRVLHSMPSWKPAMKNGKAVKSKVIVPIVFRL